MKVKVNTLVFALCVIALVAFVDAKVVKVFSEEEIFKVNDEYPSKYSVVIFRGKATGFWTSVKGFFGSDKHKQQEEELEQIIQFFEKEAQHGIPIIEANVDTADYTHIMKEWNVSSVPWIIILDENNVVVYSKEPIPEADEEILLVMNIFPTTIMAPPTDSDEIIFDVDDDTPPEPTVDANYPYLNTTATEFPRYVPSNRNNTGTTKIKKKKSKSKAKIVPVRPHPIEGELKHGPQLHGSDIPPQRVVKN